jgi:hypothetical protein
MRSTTTKRDDDDLVGGWRGGGGGGGGGGEDVRRSLHWAAFDRLAADNHRHVALCLVGG